MSKKVADIVVFPIVEIYMSILSEVMHLTSTAVFVQYLSSSFQVQQGAGGIVNDYL